jgi:hypothetical protein
MHRIVGAVAAVLLLTSGFSVADASAAAAAMKLIAAIG